MSRKVTIHDVAKALKIDSSTVSRALNNSERVTEKTKKKVLSMATKLGYQRNLLASNLRKNKSNTIGVIVPRISRYFFSSTISGIEEAAYQEGYNVIICQSLDQLKREKKIIQNLISNRVDGVLVSVSLETGDGNHFKQFNENNIPLVFFDRHCEDIKEAAQVLLDDESAGFDATEHLINQGCSNIVHFAGPKNLSIYKNRLKGYKKALKKYKMPYNSKLVVTSRLMEKDGWKNTKILLDKYPDIDGIFSANDVTAIGAMKYIKSIGLQIPKDISIIGFSNEPSSEVIEPALSTIDQSGFEIGKIACDLLVNKLKSEDPQSINLGQKVVTVKPTLLIRESSKNLK